VTWHGASERQAELCSTRAKRESRNHYSDANTIFSTLLETHKEGTEMNKRILQVLIGLLLAGLIGTASADPGSIHGGGFDRASTSGAHLNY
jgi:hypothetical protein